MDKKRLLNIILVFLLFSSLFPINNYSVVGDPPIQIFLITSPTNYTTYGFTDLGIYYTPNSLTSFHMPFIVERKGSFQNLVKGDLDKKIQHKTGSFDKRFCGYDFDILASNEDYYVIDFSMQTYASNKSFSIDFVPKIKGVEFSQFAWWNSSWNNWVSITINCSYIDVTLSNFPVMINITDSIADLCDGGDSIRFLNVDNITKYYYEIEKWVDGSDRIVWVKIPSVSNSVNTIFLMYYGNVGASDTQNPSSTWDSDFVGVYHMNDASGNIVDSKGNQNGVVNATPDYRQSGQFGWAINFDGVNDWFNITNDVYKMEDNWCVEIWQNCDLNHDDVARYLIYIGGETLDRQCKIMQLDDDLPIDGFNFYNYGSGAADSVRTDDGGDDLIQKWLYFGCSEDEDGDNLCDMFVNDTLQAETDMSSSIDLGGSAIFIASIGALGRAATSNYYDGKIEEVRVSKIARSDAWRKASFYTTDLSIAFLTWGTPIAGYDVDAPSNFIASTVNNIHINISWTKHVNASTTIVERNTSSSWNRTEGTQLYNGIGSYYVDNYSGLSCGTIYYYRGFTHNATSDSYSDSNMSSNITCPDDPSNLIIVAYPGGFVNFTWTNNNMADATAIIRKDGSFPTSPTDGTEVYNGTNPYYNDSGVLGSHLYMLYSWNNTVNQHSDGYQAGWGGLTINVYDSNTSLAIDNWDVFIVNNDKTDTFESTNNSNPFFIDIGKFPYGTNTMLVINASFYNSEIFYMDLELNMQYTLNAYLTDINETSSYIIRVIDENDEGVNDARVNVIKYINDSVGYQNVSILITDGYGFCPSIILVPGNKYAVKITADNFDSVVYDMIPITIVFDVDRYFTFKIFYSTPEFEPDTFQNVILFCSGTGWNTDNDTLHVSIYDKYSEMSDISFVVYEYYNGSLVENASYTFSGSSAYDVDVWVSGLNMSRMHRVTITSMNHTSLGHVTNVNCDIAPILLDDDDPSITDLETKFSDAGGDFSMGYVQFLLLYSPGIAILLILGLSDPGFAIVITSLYYILISGMVDLINLEYTIVLLIGISLPLGITVIVTKRGKHIT